MYVPPDEHVTDLGIANLDQVNMAFDREASARRSHGASVKVTSTRNPVYDNQ